MGKMPQFGPAITRIRCVLQKVAVQFLKLNVVVVLLEIAISNWKRKEEWMANVKMLVWREALLKLAGLIATTGREKIPNFVSICLKPVQNYLQPERNCLSPPSE
jgi:hypothetical protein